ncbi:carboxypeptidase S [Schizophyllum amplum]|uniref:Carboxypeptidase S n=1 Tax=Schizophyllum amplum TaxID=97359 RepID=A0A550C493_9AGAR|nr:carboxypeptidase S [Auriculariopsis ampla]
MIGRPVAHAPLCPQADILYPVANKDLWEEIAAELGTEAFQNKALDWMRGAIQIPTEVFDAMGEPGEDSRWDIFYEFHDYLLKSYPLVHSTMSLTKVNTFGLPILLTAHQDVVPVLPSTVPTWEHPPYSGYFDGERIWGRGASDDKSGLISIMNILETLIKKEYMPTRGIVLAFGFDEEASGTHVRSFCPGAYLLKTFGKNAFAMVVDEGGGYSEEYGTVVATPGIAEKGYMDTKVEVHSPGGKCFAADRAPAHTTIGILARLLVEYENNPYDVRLVNPQQPVYLTHQCHAEHAPGLPEDLRDAILASATSPGALQKVEDFFFKDKKMHSIITTTQAADMINGGVKSNALPEEAWAIINHRISITSSVAETMAHDTATVKALAEQFNLTFEAFGTLVSEADAPSSGKLVLEAAFNHSLNPAPVTPLYGEDADPYRFLHGTIKATYNAHHNLEGNDNIIVAPGMSSGNTDTKYYWDLTPHIFRYNHKGTPVGRVNGVHTVNDVILELDAYVEEMLFFATLILNADESTVL